MARGISFGTNVRVGKGNAIPKRYQGRSAVVVGRDKKTSYGQSVYLVSFGTRRATPLPVRESFLQELS